MGLSAGGVWVCVDGGCCGCCGPCGSCGCVVLVVVVVVNTWANVAVKVWVAAVEIERAVGGQVGR